MVVDRQRLVVAVVAHRDDSRYGACDHDDCSCDADACLRPSAPGRAPIDPLPGIGARRQRLGLLPQQRFEIATTTLAVAAHVSSRRVSSLARASYRSRFTVPGATPSARATPSTVRSAK